MSFSYQGLQLLVPHWGGGAAVSPPVADFTSNVLFGTVPFEVEFTDLSTNTPTSWEWDFGDGSAVSNDQNPTHEYTAPGVYTVTLTATNADGSDAEEKTDYISAYREVTLVLQPDAATGEDVEIYSVIPTYNYGLLSGLNLQKDFVRSLIKFDLSSIPATAIISNATLTLYCHNYTAPGFTASMHRALTQWFEGQQSGAAPDPGQDGSTWNLRNANGSLVWAGGAGGAGGSDWEASATISVVVGAINTAYDFSVASDVSSFVAGSSNYGWWILSDSTAANGFRSSDWTTPTQRPKLVVVYRTTTPA